MYITVHAFVLRIAAHVCATIHSTKACRHIERNLEGIKCLLVNYQQLPATGVVHLSTNTLPLCCKPLQWPTSNITVSEAIAV